MFDDDYEDEDEDYAWDDECGEDEDNHWGGQGTADSRMYVPPSTSHMDGNVIHGRLRLMPRSNSVSEDSPFDDLVDTLMPSDFAPEADEYNPFKYTYELKIPELGMTVWVSFRLEGELDLEGPREEIRFTKDGVNYSFPFFFPANIGTDPGDHYDGTLYEFYRRGERMLWMVPEVHKAVINTPGKEPASITKQAFVEYVTSDRLLDAILDFKDTVDNDPKSPLGLRCLLRDFAMYPHERTPWDSRVEGCDQSRNPEYQGLAEAVAVLRQEYPGINNFGIKEKLEKAGRHIDLRLTPIRAAFGLPPMNQGQRRKRDDRSDDDTGRNV